MLHQDLWEIFAHKSKSITVASLFTLGVYPGSISATNYITTIQDMF